MRIPDHVIILMVLEIADLILLGSCAIFFIQIDCFSTRFWLESIHLILQIASILHLATMLIVYIEGRCVVILACASVLLLKFTWVEQFSSIL